MTQDEERYEIKGKIGEGGRGAVYRAYDRQLNRNVAIKRLLKKGDQDGETSQEAILKESHALSSISSPHIVRVFDVARDEDGPYVVMEYLDGKTLHQVVSKAPLVYDDFITVAEQSLEALIAAHDAKLLHRDIKPANLMLTWLPSGRIQLKLLDFGLAKFTEKPAVQTISHGSSVLGSIYFMAPEQFERTPLDARTDLYSLGCVLFYALTGQYPFSGDNVTEVMAAHIQGDCKDLPSLRADLPAPICAWIMSLLARQPDDRPPNAHIALETFGQAREEARHFTAPVSVTAPQVGPRLITGLDHTTATQVVPLDHQTGTNPVPTLTTATTIVGARAQQIRRSASPAIPHAVIWVCGLLILSIVALGFALAVRGDPSEDIPPPKPAQGTENSGKASSNPPAKTFQAKDANNDRRVTLVEYVSSAEGAQRTKLVKEFKKRDKNRDGFLTPSEFRGRNPRN